MSTFNQRLRRITGRLLLMLAPLLVLLFVVEVGLRLVGPAVEADPQEESRFIAVVPSPELGWIFPADTLGTFRSSGRHTPLVTNSWGLRSEPLSEGDGGRILILGDSYAFGWGVAEDSSFGVRLGDALDMDVVNAAIPGYSIYQQVRMFDFVTARTNVDLVVATISLANDAIDEERIRRYAPDRLAEFDYGLRDPGSFSARVIGTSRLLTLIDQRTTHIQFGLINAGGSGRDLAAQSLKDLADRCRERGLPLVWVIVPRNGEVRGGGVMTGFLNRKTAGLRDHFLEATTAWGSGGLDLLPVLLDAQNGGECYLPGDAHWNERGHRVVADALTPVVKQAMITPR